MKIDKILKTLECTDAELHELVKSAQAAWSAIASDVLENTPRMSRASVIEVTLDANYIEMYGRPNPRTKEILAGVHKNPGERYKALVEAMKPHFSAEVR